MRWILGVGLAGKQYVIVNMDETHVSQLTTGDKGTVPHNDMVRQESIKRLARKIDRTEGKTSLLACVCNDASLQPKLPQVFLPRYSKDSKPPEHVLDMFEDTGFPFEYWHSTTGMASVPIIKAWMTRLRAVVHKHNPAAYLLVVLDCATVHVAYDVLLHARKLGIILVLVPSRLTWMTQLLDVYVFSRTKWLIRNEMMRGSVRQNESVPSVGDWINACSRGARQAIVETDW